MRGKSVIPESRVASEFPNYMVRGGSGKGVYSGKGHV